MPADPNTTATPDHERIWLQPRPPAGVPDDRTWCQDDVWTHELDHGGDPPTEYVRADLMVSFAQWVADYSNDPAVVWEAKRHGAR